MPHWHGQYGTLPIRYNVSSGGGSIPSSSRMTDA